jgi:hypothetical protein
MGTQYVLARRAANTTVSTLELTVTQDGHSKKGQSFRLEIWEGAKIDTSAKSSALQGKGPWIVARTVPAADDPKLTIDGVPAEETVRYVEFMGAGAAATNVTATITVKLPGQDPDIFRVEGWAWENCGSTDIKKEGSTMSAEGGYVRSFVNGIDPLEIAD